VQTFEVWLLTYHGNDLPQSVNTELADWCITDTMGPGGTIGPASEYAFEIGVACLSIGQPG
jgi:hypothetical protein